MSAPNAGLQLFPPPPSKKKPSRKPSQRRHAVQPQSPPTSAVERATSPDFANDGRQSAMGGSQSALDGRVSPQPGPSNLQIASEISRSQSSFSEAPTLVRSHSVTSHNSTAKTHFQSPPSRPQPVIHSIFPRYNPEIPLEQQQYYPTQASPTHIPKAIISKRPYSPSIAESSMGSLRSPMSAPATVSHFPNGVLDIPQMPEAATTEELKELWKVTNGWRVSASEGRTFCLKLNSATEAPIHTLSSADSQPFYTIQLDPTSTSALLTMTRQDPNIKTKAPAAGASPRIVAPRTGLEVLTTTLEEKVRRLPPNDGLVALLYPRAAANMVIELAAKAAGSSSSRPGQGHSEAAAGVVAAAERECGRLVWDEDTAQYYLVHPAAFTPFRVRVRRFPAWSRTEYVLEHAELPQHLVRLTCDGAGAGVLEVDTGVAARLDCFYIVDVAVCAVLVVALAEEKAQSVERFDAPPPPSSAGAGAPISPKEKEKKKKEAKKAAKIEEMEIDLESQQSLSKENMNLPRSTRGILHVLYMLLKFMVWVITFFVTTIAKIIIWASESLAKKTVG